MASWGSAAYRMGSAAPDVRRERVTERAERPSLDVVEGGGLDARAREGVSGAFLATIGRVLVAAAVLAVLGACRVGISVATLSLLQSTSELRTEISEVETTNDELRISRSILSSSSRISRIATQNLGMVLAEDTVTVTVDLSSDDADADATDADTPAETVEAFADGDAVAQAGEDAAGDSLS